MMVSAILTSGSHKKGLGGEGRAELRGEGRERDALEKGLEPGLAL